MRVSNPRHQIFQVRNFLHCPLQLRNHRKCHDGHILVRNDDTRLVPGFGTSFHKPSYFLMFVVPNWDPELRSLLPFLIYETSLKNDFSRIAATATQLLDQLDQSISNGMQNAIACAEDVPFYDKKQRLIKNSEDTYMGGDFHQTLMEICSDWPVGQTNESMKQVFTSKTPSLILSGQYDPVTPPSYGEQLASNLENRLHIIGEGQGHGLISRGCIPKIISDFLEDPNLENLRTSCVKHLKPVPFFVNAYGPSP